MKPTTLLLILALIATAITPALADESVDTLVEELYIKSGLEKQMAQIPATLEMGFSQAAATNPKLSALPKSTLDTFNRSETNDTFIVFHINIY